MDVRYTYTAKDKSGRTIKGQKDAPSREGLITELERNKLVVISVEETQRRKGLLRGIGQGDRTSLRSAKVKTFELIIFCRQLATMLQGGVPILRAIESISVEVKDKRLREILRGVRQHLRDGKMASESFKEYPGAFSTLFVTIVEAGEKVGSLDEMLQRLSIYLESRDRLIKKVRSATAYPAFIAAFFLIAVGVITLFLIPRFHRIYTGFGAELPGLTLLVFEISSFFLKNIYIILSILIVGVFSISFLMTHSKRARTSFDSAVLKLPVFGEVLKKAAVSKFCRTLSILLSHGISITEALFLVGKTSGNIIIENASEKAGGLVMEGDTIPDALEKMAVFPSLMLQMVSIGEEAGSLPELLDKTADFYEEQVDMFINTLTSMIEPILVVSLGGVVAVVVVALYLPIFRLGSAALGGGV